LKPVLHRDELVKEVEFLCPELQGCNSLRKTKHADSIEMITS